MPSKYGSSDVLEQNKDKVIKMLAQGRNPEIVSARFGVSERTLWNWLKKNNITVSSLRENYQRQKLELIKKGLDDVDKLKSTPVDYEEFINLESIKKFVEEQRASNNSEDYINSTLKYIFDICQTLNIHPELLDAELVNKYIVNVKDKYKDTSIQRLKACLRQWLKFLNKPIPKSLSIKEYDGKYKQAYLNVEERLEFLRTAKKLYPDEYKKIKAIAEFLFYTGSRSEALQNVKFKPEEECVKVITLEKGKGGKIQWEKTITKTLYEEVKNYLPLNNGDLNKLRDIFRNIIAESQINDIAKKYGFEHPLHLWRHTACVSCLYAFNWNIYVTGKLLGWKNPKMIINVYGDIPSNILVKLALGEKVETPPFQFLYNSYLEQAKAEGLV